MADGKAVLELLAENSKAILAIEQVMQKQNAMFQGLIKQTQEAKTHGKSFTDGMVAGLESMVMRYASVGAIVAILQQASAAQREYSAEVLKTVSALDEQARRAALAAGLTAVPKGLIPSIGAAAREAAVPIGAAMTAQVELGLTPEQIRGGTLAEALKLQKAAGGQLDFHEVAEAMGASRMDVTPENLRLVGGKAAGIFGVAQMGPRLAGLLRVSGAGTQAGLSLPEMMAAEQSIIERGFGGRRPEGTLSGVLEKLNAMPGATLEDKLARLEARANRLPAAGEERFYDKIFGAGAGGAGRVLAENIGDIRARAAAAGGAGAWDESMGMLTTGPAAESVRRRNAVELARARHPALAEQAIREERVGLWMEEQNVPPGMRWPAQKGLAATEFGTDLERTMMVLNPMVAPIWALHAAILKLTDVVTKDAGATEDNTRKTVSSPVRGSK